MADNTTRIQEQELSPSEYFDIVKGKRKEITDEELRKVYDNALILLNKYKITGQTAGMKKLIFLIETAEKERAIVKSGINTFVYKDDIEDYIDHVAKDVVKIIELERYERDIPEEIVDVIAEYKNLFDEMYIVFTDYTGKVERQVERERRAKDPILFGTFQDVKTRTLIERFYFLGDWEDEFCDLTLDKMVKEMKESKNKNIVRTINTPSDIEELKQQLADLDPQNGSYKIKEEKERKHKFFKNIRIGKKRNKA